MHRILFEIIAIAKHLHAMRNDSKMYRPKPCPDCGFGKPWGHRCDFCKADGVAGIAGTPVHGGRCALRHDAGSTGRQGAVLLWVALGAFAQAAGPMADVLAGGGATCKDPTPPVDYAASLP